MNAAGMTIQADNPLSATPVTAAAIAPKKSCPSPPTLNIPACAATAIANPVRQSVTLFAAVLPNALVEPNAPFISAP